MVSSIIPVEESLASCGLKKPDKKLHAGSRCQLSVQHSVNGSDISRIKILYVLKTNNCSRQGSTDTGAAWPIIIFSVHGDLLI